MGNYHVDKVERTTLGSHDLAVSVFQNFLPTLIVVYASNMNDFI